MVVFLQYTKVYNIQVMCGTGKVNASFKSDCTAELANVVYQSTGFPLPENRNRCFLKQM